MNARGTRRPRGGGGRGPKVRGGGGRSRGGGGKSSSGCLVMAIVGLGLMLAAGSWFIATGVIS